MQFGIEDGKSFVKSFVVCQRCLAPYLNLCYDYIPAQFMVGLLRLATAGYPALFTL